MTIEPDADVPTDADPAVDEGDMPAAPRRRRVSSAAPAAPPRRSSTAGDQPSTAQPSTPQRAKATVKPDGIAARTGPSSARTLLPWALAILGLLGTIGFAVAWQQARGSDAPSDGPTAETVDVRAAATDFSKALTNFDGASIDRDFDRIIARSGGDFSKQADTFFSTKTRKDLKEAQASSRGEVRSAYVQEVDGTNASAFVVVDQTIANNKAPQPRADTLRMELKLQRVSGRWKVTNVEVLTAPVDAAGLAGEPTSTTTGG